jgi:hypothetical protein
VVTEAHRLVAWLAIVATVALLAAATWSTVDGRRSRGARDHRFAVDRLVIVVEGILLVAAVLGAASALGGARPGDGLHLLYGPASLVSLPIGWALGGRPDRGGSRTRLRRDAWLLLAAVVLVGIEVRLFATGC